MTRCLLWHGWLPGISGAGHRAPWAASFELESRLGAYPADFSGHWLPPDYWDADDVVHRYTSHESFSRTLFTLCTHHIVAQGVFGAHSLHLHVIHDVTRLSVRCLFSFCRLPFSLAPQLSLHCLPVLCPAHQLPQVESAEGQNHCTHAQ